MNRNPYSPPESDVAEVAQSIDINPRRPIAVWIFMTFLALVVLSLTSGFVVSLWWLAKNPSGTSIGVQYMVGLLLRLTLLCLFVAALVSIYRGKQWMRWVGSAMLAAFTIWVFFKPTTNSLTNGGVAVQFVLMPLTMGSWVYTYGFSAKAKRYWYREELNL